MSPFQTLLRQRRNAAGRRLTVTQLARDLGMGRTHLALVLAGRRAGGETWPRLEPLLTESELAALGRTRQGGMEQSSTRNSVSSLEAGA